MYWIPTNSHLYFSFPYFGRKDCCCHCIFCALSKSLPSVRFLVVELRHAQEFHNNLQFLFTYQYFILYLQCFTWPVIRVWFKAHQLYFSFQLSKGILPKLNPLTLSDFFIVQCFTTMFFLKALYSAAALLWVWCINNLLEIHLVCAI